MTMREFVSTITPRDLEAGRLIHEAVNEYRASCGMPHERQRRFNDLAQEEQRAWAYAGRKTCANIAETERS